MVRITLYDPKVSAEVYSQRRAAEESFDSGVATGLARLGRALTERERGFRAAGSEVAGLESALGFWESEQRLLDAAGAKIPRGKPGFHDAAMRRHLERRRQEIVRLKEEQGVEAATRFERHTQALTGMLERRAGAMEAAASGDGLADGMAAAMTRAVSAVKSDPLQHDAIVEAFDVTLAEMEANGVDPTGIAGTREAVRRNVGMAAVNGLIGEREFEAARELLAEDRLPGLAEEDRKHLGRQLQRAEARAAADDEAETAAGIDAYWAGFEDLRETLHTGGEAPDVDYSDETIRRVLPEDQAEKMITLRTEAEDRGAAYRGILLADRATIEAMIAESGPEQGQLLRELVEERDAALRDDPAAFILAHPWVRGAYDRLLAAIESGDADAIAAAGRAYARGTVNEQQRLGIPEVDQQVLPPDLAAETAAAFHGTDSSDPVALGTELQARYGELAPTVLKDLVRAGLPQGVAIIAAMRRPGQREAARALSALVGTPTSELRRRISQSDAEAVDRALNAIRPDHLPGDPTDPESAAMASLIERRIYDLMGSGEALDSAVITAVSDIMGDSAAGAAELRRSVADRLSAVSAQPAADQSADVRGQGSSPVQTADQHIALTEQITTLAERLGLDRTRLPPVGTDLRDVLIGLDGYETLSGEERDALGRRILALRDTDRPTWRAVLDKYIDVLVTADPPPVPAEPAPLHLRPGLWDLVASNDRPLDGVAGEVQSIAGQLSDDQIEAFREFEERSGLWIRPLANGQIGIVRADTPESFLPVSREFADFIARHPDLARDSRVDLPEADFLPDRLIGNHESFDPIEGDDIEDRRRRVSGRWAMAQTIGRDLSRLFRVGEVRQPQIDVINDLLQNDDGLGTTVALSIAGFLWDQAKSRSAGNTHRMTSSEIMLRGNLDGDRLAALLEQEYLSGGEAVEIGPLSRSDEYRSALFLQEGNPAFSNGVYWGLLPGEYLDRTLGRVSRLVDLDSNYQPIQRSDGESKALEGLVETLVAPSDLPRARYLAGAVRALGSEFEDWRGIPSHYYALLSDEVLFEVAEDWGLRYPINPEERPDIPPHLEDRLSELAGVAGHVLSAGSFFADMDLASGVQTVAGVVLGEIAAEDGDVAMRSELAEYWFLMEVHRRARHWGPEVYGQQYLDWKSERAVSLPETDEGREAIPGPQDFVGSSE